MEMCCQDMHYRHELRTPKSGQNAPRSLSLVPLTMKEACRRGKYDFWTQAMSEAGMGEAVLFEEGILAMSPSGKTYSIHLAETPICQLFLSFVCNIYQIVLGFIRFILHKKKSVYHHSSAGFCSVFRGPVRRWRAAQLCNPWAKFKLFCHPSC